ncbi:DUF294 nucleotidyltransferase-like domain-containing protein [Alkalimarinus alittae]|uniref:DUF294 nucleotidyltransferase-like domain-containing protein n=1 Tax=Alkalimarinus alittae TaxID=2961619 RepID=A0ABY6N5R9_9ALTE|nr:DUF294 nucleotidyltransferase-like domain-containing protein [Alkalimarinus alittae]UZE97327.1 DUF294 nucleotidyltransferase-like domain-containing protein [Alkalimarinus alittae]
MTQEETGKSAVQQNIRALMTFLNQYPPFSQMEDSHIASLLEQATLTFYADGDVILSPDLGVVGHFYIVKQGNIRGERKSTQRQALINGETYSTPDTSSKMNDAAKAPASTTFEIAPGECFPIAALVSERATQTVHRASGDTFCLKIPRDHFVKIFTQSDIFRDFCVRGVSSLLDQVNQKIQKKAVETLGRQHSLDQAISELAIRNPIVCTPDLPLQKAISVMHNKNVGSIIITNDSREPSGIFTLRDVRRVIAEGQCDFNVPISSVMTPNPMSLPSSASAFEAALLMATHHFAHVCVVDEDNKLTGVVSERDLFSLQRVDLVHLARAIASASSVVTLLSIREDITQLIDTMIAYGAASQQLNHIITLLNDYTVVRVIELTIQSFGDPGVPFTWLVFGSEGRKEQTLVTDQDNGILFQAPEGMTNDQARSLLLPLAKEINTRLDECGFTWCKGNIMASNPDLCRSRSEWEEWYYQFINTNTPENLLNSSIFLDMRPIWGDEKIATDMFKRVVAAIQKNTLFQKMMAVCAMHNRPPLNMFKGFVYAKGGEKNTLDLKIQGLTPFVDAARILSLGRGIIESNTIDRIQALVECGAMDRKDANAWIESYGLIQLLRMRNHQELSRHGKTLTNRISPAQLNQLDQRILREAFRQAKRLQHKLEVTYAL